LGLLKFVFVNLRTFVSQVITQARVVLSGVVNLPQKFLSLAISLHLGRERGELPIEALIGA
jgi:hypothetical protein